MPYVENRVVHDADSHLMELHDALDEFLETNTRAVQRFYCDNFVDLMGAGLP
jgi:hypothetical protein